MQSLADAVSLADLLTIQAENLPEQRFVFLEDGERKEAILSYADLERRAVAIAASLRKRAKAGDRVLILLPLGLDYTVAVLACTAAGMVAVPAYPPEPGAAAATLAPIVAIIEDCAPSLLLLDGSVALALQSIDGVPASLAALPQVVVDDLAGEGKGARRDWRVDTDDAAVMLYTSGSTGSPKGVVLTHGNFLHVSRVTALDCRLDPSSVFCAWVPGYHISGLFSGITLPLWAGATCVGFAPRSFVERPARWLEAIDRHGATFSGAPTFAYDMLARSVTPAESAELDLSRWQTAVIGGEAVRRDVLERFTERFAANGFARNRFYTMFGLTEAVMISTGSGYQAGPIEEWIDRDRLQEGQAIVVPADSASGRASIASGYPLPETDVRIVDPTSRRTLGARAVGEIWIGGKGVGQGYWAREEATSESFRAHTADGAGPFLRTGDFAYLADGQIHIVGRLKEMIIIRGLNFYPDDLEASIRRADPRLAAAKLAAFAVELDGQETLAVAIEMDGAEDPGLSAAVRRTITTDHGIQVGALLLLPPGAIPMTSTGKVQRRNCAQCVASGVWKIAASSGEAASVADTSFDRVAFAALPPAEKGREAVRLLRRLVAKLAGIGEDAVAADRPVSEFGIDSILSVKLALEIQDRFAVSVPTAKLRDATSIETLAELILAGGGGVAEVTDRVLPETIRPEEDLPARDPETIFITGATGFLGAFLLHELLLQTDARICCLVRAENSAAGLRRLAAKLDAVGLWEDRFEARLEAINGDLGQPLLGMGETVFADLARRVDAIYHNGASVDFVAPYSALERANVDATIDCLKLATTGRAKSMHFTSTLAVLNGGTRMALARITERDRLGGPQELTGGYAQSKWVAESVLAQAGARGVPVGIYRAGFIGGHAQSGFWNTEDFLCRLIKGSVQLGLYPDVTLDLPFVSVDYVARAIVTLSRNKQPGAEVSHLIAPTPLSFRNLMRWIADMGHELKPIPYARWRRLLRDSLPITNDLYPVLPFLIEAGPDGESVVDLFVKPDQPSWTDDVTRARLDGTGIVANGVDRAYVQRCLGYFHKVGFLPEPEPVA